MTIRVYLADDHAIIRDGLRALLEEYPEIAVVGDSGIGHQILADVNSLHPDVVLMDILMPDLNGVDATRIIHTSSPQTKVIILSILGTPEYVLGSFKAGARGYLVKESTGREVVDAIFRVSKGEIFLSQLVTCTLITDFLNLHENPEGTSPLMKLSKREREVLPLVVDGWTSVEIGKKLNLSTKTVESYRSRMMHKLGVKDASGLIKFALRTGLIP